MKKTLALISMVLFAAIASAQTSKEIYNKYSDKSGVSAVYVSPAMFKLMKVLPDINVKDGNVNITKMVQSLDGMYILNTENSSVGDSIYKEVDRMVKAGKYEVLLESKENGEVARIYSVGKGDCITDLVLLTGEGKETSFIAISGKIDAEDLAKLLKE